MYNFVLVLMLDCWWKEGYYAAFQSTSDHYILDVYLNAARSLHQAMSTKRRWVKQSYQMPWVELIRRWFLLHRGAEICLWTNNFPHGRGVTIGYRFLAEPLTWIYARIRIPGVSRTKIQLTYLKWGSRFEDYATDIWHETGRSEHGKNDVWPFVYPPKGKSIEEVRTWVREQAEQRGFRHRLPFIEKVLVYYVAVRWGEH